MEQYIIEKDIDLLYVTADSFPNGIMKAFEEIHRRTGDNNKGKTYGISRPDKNGEIIYKAAVDKRIESEQSLGSFTVKAGTYASITIPDFMERLSEIGEAFKVLTTKKDIDPNGWCLEIYQDSKTVICLVVSGEDKGE